MKVYINNYKNHWLSPYTILEKVLFWKDWDNIDYNTPWVEKWSNRLNPLCKALQKVLDFVDPKIDYVKIDRWDTWSMDHTLSYIVLPMLKQLNETKHGAPFVDDEDVPDHLRSTAAEPKENEWDTDSNHFLRWDWVMSEMIYAFECQLDDTWEDKYWTGEWGKTIWKESDRTYPNPVTGVEEPTYTMEHTGDRKCDWDGLKKEQARIQNGFRLFGKYFQALWD